MSESCDTPPDEFKVSRTKDGPKVGPAGGEGEERDEETKGDRKEK